MVSKRDNLSPIQGISVTIDFMASSREYLNYIMEQLSLVDGINYRPMMGEFLIYHYGRVVGGIYDDRFMVKAIKPALDMMPDARMELPYEGGRKMIVVDNVEDREFLKKLFEAMYQYCP